MAGGPLGAAQAQQPRRRRWVAVSLAVLSPGLGHLYLGQIRATTTIAAALLIWLAIILCTPINATMAGAITAMAVFLLLYVLQIVHAGRISGLGSALHARRWARWSIYTGYVLFASAIPQVMKIGIETADLRATRPFSTPSGSMSPTIQIGDFMFARRRGATVDWPVHGDLVIYWQTIHDGREVEWIGRVAGLGGDRVQLRDGRVIFNDVVLDRAPNGEQAFPAAVGPSGATYMTTAASYRETQPSGKTIIIVESDGDRGRVDDTAPYVVPDGHMFILRDNRDNSFDSRLPQHGFIPLRKIWGEPRFLYWSKDLSRIGGRLE